MVFLWSRHVERYFATIKATLELEQNDVLQRSTHSRRFLSLSLSLLLGLHKLSAI